MKAVQRLRKRAGKAIPIERVIVFGSRARGTSGPMSDVDLLVVSPAFDGKTVVERAAPLYRAWDSDMPVDFLCYSPRELAEAMRRVTMARIAVEEGIEVAA